LKQLPQQHPRQYPTATLVLSKTFLADFIFSIFNKQWLGQFSKALGRPAFYRGEHPR
jgi:hypothetical protein